MMGKIVYQATVDNGFSWLCACDSPIEDCPEDMTLRELGEYDSLTEFLEYWASHIYLDGENNTEWNLGNILMDISDVWDDDMTYDEAVEVICRKRYDD